MINRGIKLSNNPSSIYNDECLALNKYNKKIFILIFLFAIFSQFAFSETPDRILSNSGDWRDVYSSMQYGNLESRPASFLVSNRHATLILNSIAKNNHIWAVSSKSVPYVVGYKSILESRGYTAEEYVFDNVNLGLAGLLTDVNNFIILDDSYGYNAISVAPYAIATNSYVLFADRENINDIEDFLDSKDVGDILIYGNVDREVRNRIEKYDPEIINKEGDRFLNNIEIVKRFQELQHQKQAILTNGEFIEQEIMSGTEPVIFIGTNNVPDVVRDYVKNSDIEVGVLIGNELVGTATFVRRQIGISVFVKFAQGARAPQGAISQVEALDMYYLPVYNLNLQIESIKYNEATNMLEVTLRNTEDQAVYAIGTFSVIASDGSRFTVGDVGSNFIDGNQLKTFTYDMGSLPQGSINVEVFIIYGESQGSLEKEIRTTLEAQTVRVLDECDIEINEISYNKRNKFFYIDVENIGTVDCYVDLELIGIIIAGEKTTYSLKDIADVSGTSKKTLRVKAEGMEEEDFEDNERVKVRAYYGERKDSLIRTKERIFDFLIKGGDYLFYALILVIALLLFLIIWKRKKKKDNHRHKI